MSYVPQLPFNVGIGNGDSTNTFLQFPLRHTLQAAATFLPVLIFSLNLTLARAQEPVSTIPSPDAPPPATPPAEPGSGPKRLKEMVEITVETNLPPAGVTTNVAAPKQKRFYWNSTWQGWDGLALELKSRTRLAAAVPGVTNLPRVRLEETQMAAKIGGRLSLDAAGYITGHEFQDFDGGIELRRARIYARGDCLLLLPVAYQLEIGYIPNQFYMEESYVAFTDLPRFGMFKIGQFQAPMGLDAITSSRDTSFMEAAGPIEALSPGVNAGFEIGKAIFKERATWALGFFTAGVGQDFGDASKDYGRAITRFTGLLLDRPHPEKPDSLELLHLGLSANILYAGDSVVHYESRPESHLAPFVIDTGDITADGALVIGGEAAWVNGPLCVQGEYLHSFVRETAGSSGPTLLNFEGYYASASWFITGESRPYDRSRGRFSRLMPRRDFDWGHGGWGAFELAGRLSHVNLNSGDIHGGRMTILSAGLNWYLHSHVKWRFDYGVGNVSGREPEGFLNIFQTRVEIDF